MGIKDLNESVAPLGNMKSFLVVHEDEKLVVKKLENELQELKKMVDDLVATYPHRMKLINEKYK